MNKKGSIQDILYIAVFLLAFGMCVYIGMYIFKSFNETESTQQIMFNTTVGNFTAGKAMQTLKMYDLFFPMVMIGLTIGTIILAFYIRTHPALFIAFIIILMVTVLVSAVLSNIFEDFSNETSFETVRGYYPVMNYLMGNLPIIILIIGFIVAIVLFGTSGGNPV